MPTKQKKLSLTNGLVDRLDEIGVHYLDKLSIHLTAVGLKPSSLLFLKRDNKIIQSTIEGLQDHGFCIATPDTPDFRFFQIVVGLTHFFNSDFKFNFDSELLFFCLFIISTLNKLTLY